MASESIPYILVTGTGATFDSRMRRAARLVGRMLAEQGCGLVTGTSTGVDKWTAQAFCAVEGASGRDRGARLRQLALPWTRFFRRGSWPWPGYQAPHECVETTGGVEEWRLAALHRSDAAIMIGGGGGALDIALRFIELGKPVFPIPFTGGESDFVFQEVLKTWDSHRVPGLSRSQFLRLAEPWTIGTGPLSNLLRCSLARRREIFISYRRSDSPAAAGRLAQQLMDHFGERRIFFDIRGIAPSEAWDRSIEDALRDCDVGVVVIGPRWYRTADTERASRLHQPDDVVRLELDALLSSRKAIFPILVEGARPPEAVELPENLTAFSRIQATAMDNAHWEETTATLIREIEHALHRVQSKRIAPADADHTRAGER